MGFRRGRQAAEPAGSADGRTRGSAPYWENPEAGDEPFATLTDRDTALLAAAFLPLVDRARSFYVDPEDAAGHIVTYNWRDFRGAERFGVRVINPEDFLGTLED